MKTKKIILLGILVILISSCSKGYDFYLKTGMEYARDRNFEPAIKYFTKAIRLNRDSDVAYFWRGRVFVQMEKYDDAIADFTMAIKLNDSEAVYFFQRAFAYRMSERLEMAIDDFTTVIEMDDKFPQIYIRRGMVYFDLQNDERARADFEKSIEINPDDLGAYVHLAWVNMVEYQADLVLENINYVIAKNPNYFDEGIGIEKGMIFFMRAQVHSHFDNHEKAIADLKIALDMGFEDARRVLRDKYGIDYP